MLWNLIAWCLFGAIAGGIARLVVPGRDPMGWLGTIALGILGSFIGGTLASLFVGGFRAEIQPAGWLGSILGATVALLVYRRLKLTSRTY